MSDKPNVLEGLNQKVRGKAWSSCLWTIMDTMPPAHRTGPHHPEIHAEQGKPITLPATAGEPRGTLLAWWVKECGESECLSVMDGIRAETLPDAKAGRLPRGHSWRENLD
jgi:RNA-directed DNA polymerase